MCVPWPFRDTNNLKYIWKELFGVRPRIILLREDQSIGPLGDMSVHKVILGEKAAAVLLKHAARASHHEFPYAMTVATQLIGCTNGAHTEVFPGLCAEFGSRIPPHQDNNEFNDSEMRSENGADVMCGFHLEVMLCVHFLFVASRQRFPTTLKC